MSRLAALQSRVLVDVENAIREGDTVDSGVLGSFNAGAEAIIRQNRVATDAELLALHNLADHVVGLVHEVAETVAGDTASGGEVSVPSLAPGSPAAVAEPETAGEPSGSGAEVTQPPAEESAPAEPDPDFSQPGERSINVPTSEALFAGEEAHDEPPETEDDGA